MTGGVEMDDRLVERWRAGESTAATAVRNAVRSLAERVFTHSALLGALAPEVARDLRSDDNRRLLTADVAREVMERGAQNGAQLTAMALMVAGRHAVERLQRGRPATGDGHLPAQMLVSRALAPGAGAAHIRDATEKHLEACRVCADHVHVIERAIRSHEVADPSARPDGLTEEVARITPEINAAAASRVARRRRPPKRATVIPAPERRRGLVPLLLVLAGCAALAATVWRVQGPAAGPADFSGLETLADLSPPDLGRLSDLPDEAQLALRDLSRGDCLGAGGRLRKLRTENAQVLRLYVLEGASFSCAGKRAKALTAFAALDDHLEETQQDPPRSSYWYRAQALLADGQIEAALPLLDLTRMHDSVHRALADDQAAAIRERMER